jgi:hypothetical protein
MWIVHVAFRIRQLGTRRQVVMHFAQERVFICQFPVASALRMLFLYRNDSATITWA